MTQHPRHPKGLWIIAYTNLWDTFSYFGTCTMIVLYMMHVFHLSLSHSYLIFGAYATLAYALPVFGGMVADHILGGKFAMGLGVLMTCVGNLSLMSPHRFWFYVGITLSLLGSGLFKSTSYKLNGELYDPHDSQKEAGYTWMYAAINIGGILGPLVYGFVAYHYGWSYGFLCSAIGVASGFIWYVLQNHQVKESQAPKLNLSKILFTLLALLAVCLIFSLALLDMTWLNIALLTLFLSSLAYLIFQFMQHHGQTRRRLWALFLLSVFAMFYFLAAFQIATTVVTFLQHDINLGIIQTHLPSSTFNTLFCLFVLLLTPVATLFWRHKEKQGKPVHVASRVGLGVMFAVMGLLLFAVATISHAVYVWIILAYVFMSAGELVIVPATYTAVSNFAPDNMKSTMMGCWLFFIALGGYLSSLMANAAHRFALHVTDFANLYTREFLFVAGVILLMGLIILALVGPVKKMLSAG